MAERDQTSIWKKEISFRRKPKAEAPSPPVPAVPASKPAETSVWKKEISFRRKPKPEARRDPWPEDVVRAKPAESSVWKKEISFRRKPKVDPVAPPPVSTAPPTTPEPGWPTTGDAGTADRVVPAVPPEVAPLVLPPMTPSSVAPPLSLPPQPAPPVVPGFPPNEPGQDEVAASEVETGVSTVPPVLPAAAPPPVPEPQVPGEAAAAPEPAPVSEAEASPEPEPTPEAALEPAPSRRLRRRERGEAKNGSAAHSQLVGLKIGASQVAAAQVINRGGPRIVRMARMPLQRGVVVGGELREPEALANELKAFFKKNKLPRTSVRLGISNNRIGVRTFEITGIDDPQQLANAVRFRAQETLPIPLDEAVLDHRILEDKVGEDGVRVCRVLLVVAHRELVERYVGACRKAGLKLVGIDLEAFALLRALSDPEQPPEEDAAVVCVSIGHDRSTLAVSDGRVCEFTRVLAWGGSALDGALARVLDLTPSAVVPIKHALSLRDEGEGAGLDARHADEARRAMVAELQSFARELVASLRFYQEQPNSLGIVEILITGGAATCSGLAEELERLIGIPVRLADPLIRMRGRKVQQETDLSTASMAVAVGLGIED
jgi:type IV pilus assembly protein PilM